MIENGDTEPTELSKSNVIYYRLKNGDTIVVRPSGTEPKIKFYYMLIAKDRTDGEKQMYAYHERIKFLIAVI